MCKFISRLSVAHWVVHGARQRNFLASLAGVLYGGLPVLAIQFSWIIPRRARVQQTFISTLLIYAADFTIAKLSNWSKLAFVRNERIQLTSARRRKVNCHPAKNSCDEHPKRSLLLKNLWHWMNKKHETEDNNSTKFANPQCVLCVWRVYDFSR